MMMYCADLIKYKRFHTREVKVGDLGIGGTNPIRIQSMTTTNTMDVSATVEQSMRMIEEGCELVRITAPSINEAHNLKHIRSELEKRSCFVPLIADIHFTPNAAEVAARIVQKVRVNPGNYADKKRFNIIEYSDKQYNDEIERIEKKFTPLVKICKEYGTAMRIGTNHGSLSDRIMSRYGDTPIGMVESAMEFVRICEASNYYDIILSMKASNPQVMVQAYRLLVQQMIQTKRKYPLHLGVTEAGDGEDGRVKSAVGIGALMEDGLGDTIRVSLTEEPEKEIPVAKKIIERYMNRNGHAKIEPIIKNAIDPYHYTRRRTEKALNIGSGQVPAVMINATSLSRRESIGLKVLGYHYNNITDKWNLDEMACDYIYLGSKDINYGLPGSLRKVFDFSYWKENQRGCPLFKVNEYLNAELKHKELNFLDITIKDLDQELIDIIKQDKSIVLILGTNNKHGLAEQRRAVLKLYENDCKVPVVIRRKYNTKDIE
ncbi:MAG TPA: (E)-4-hydroxy-3-methylbut-2-enyl-diphosphate synthase, partial [Bacteroidetes bacterium]|nr:(E)-4-hydroxy-3-methylbut-2-enyl-diphosphate synthase [Bacteroidota bacterium]